MVKFIVLSFFFLRLMANHTLYEKCITNMVLATSKMLNKNYS